jgi:hypothetical protein
MGTKHQSCNALVPGKYQQILNVKAGCYVTVEKSPAHRILTLYLAAN